MVRTGAHSYLKWGFETTFGTDPGDAALNKVFGLQQKATSFTLGNSKKTLAELFNIEPQSYAYGQQGGSISVDFVLSNPWWLGGLFGAPATTGANPYTHTYSIGDQTTDCDVRSLNIELGFAGEGDAGANPGATDGHVVRNLNGLILNSVNLSTSVDDLVNCSADLGWGKEDAPAITAGSFDNTPPADDINFPYTFAHGTLKWHDGTALSTLAQVQSVDLTFSQNSNLLYGLGSHQSVSAYRQLFEITGRFSASHIDHTKLDDLLAQIGKDTNTTVAREQVSMELTFTNGLSGTNEKSITITGTGIGIDSVGINGIAPVEPVFEDISWQIRSCTVAAVNSVSAEP